MLRKVCLLMGKVSCSDIIHILMIKRVRVSLTPKKELVILFCIHISIYMSYVSQKEELDDFGIFHLFLLMWRGAARGVFYRWANKRDDCRKKVSHKRKK